MLLKKKLTPADALAILKRRGWLLIVPPAMTCFAALLYSSHVPQRVPDAFVKSTVTLRTEDRLNVLTVQVTSRTLLEAMITEFSLYPDERARLPLEDVVQELRRNIDVDLETPGPGQRGSERANAFHVRFTHTDPAIAARVTQRLGSLFVEQNSQDRGDIADATDQFLETQLAQARERLEAQESRLEAFRQRHGKELPTQLPSNMQAIQVMQMQIQALVESMARDRDRKLMLERLYREAGAEPAPATSASASGAQGDQTVPVETSHRQQLSAARALLARLELRLKPEHPDVVRTKRLIAELEPKVAEDDRLQATGTATSATPMSAEELQRRERLRQMAAEIESLDRQMVFKVSEESRLRGVVAEYQRRIEAVPGIEAEWAVLTRDYDTQQAVYRELLNKSEESKLSVNLEKRQIGEHFRVLDPANVPVHPISPNRLQITGIGVFVGLLFGFAVGALLELRDATFRSEEDILEVLRLPVIAVVPYVSTVRERSRRLKTWLAVGMASAVCVAGAAYVFWAMKLWTFLV
jgi:protein tyrosine kinase modulator